jgi:predicted GNAT family N-acyltransferase
VALDVDTREIAGYHTLAASAVPAHDLPQDRVSKLKLSRYPSWSAVLIARLARRISARGQGLGELLLIDALQRAVLTTSSAGAAFIIVDAIDDNAIRFYQKYGFEAYSDSPLKLYLPMVTAEKLVL